MCGLENEATMVQPTDHDTPALIDNTDRLCIGSEVETYDDDLPQMSGILPPDTFQSDDEITLEDVDRLSDLHMPEELDFQNPNQIDTD